MIAQSPSAAIEPARFCRSTRTPAQRRREDEVILLSTAVGTSALALSVAVDSLPAAIVAAGLLVVGAPLALWWARKTR
jgi:hypothetical protein